MFASTKQLFQLNMPYTDTSNNYINALTHTLDLGVQVIAVASLMDQVVPLYSATMHALYSHNLLRLVYVQDTHLQDPFALHLVNMLVLLQNTGVRNDLIVHISGFLRGPLITVKQGTHSTISAEEEIYQTCVDWMLRHTHERALNIDQQHAYMDKRSSVAWCSKMSDQFYYSSLNAHLIKVQFEEIMALSRCKEFGLSGQLNEYISAMRAELASSSSSRSYSKGCKHLRGIFSQLLGVTNSISKL
jgi:hypothetical protein